MVNQWKLGYVYGLSGASSYPAGRALYDKFGASVLTLETGAYTFPVNRNPNRFDSKRKLNGVFKKFPYYDGGFAIPIGYEPDDIRIDVVFTNKTHSDNLEAMLRKQLDYMGNDAFTSTSTGNNLDGTAPYILETGYHDVNHQHLVFMDNYLITKDAKDSDDYFLFSINFKGYSSVIYRGI